MTPLEFSTQIDRLCRTYGEKAYPKERIEAIWERVKRIPASQFDKAVTYLIGENFTPPSLSKISDAASSFREANAAMNVLPPAFDCEPCHDFGFGWIGDTVTACTCNAGRRISPEELAAHQVNYDEGKRLMNSRLYPNIGTSLPYDQRSNVSEIDGVTR